MKNASGIRAEDGRDRPSRARGAKRAPWKRQYRLEALESRTLLSTLSFPSQGSLDYVGATATASDLTVSTNGTDYDFTDADQLITLDPTAISAGWTGSGTNTVTGPNISVTGITISTSTANDTISIDSVDASTFIDSGAGNDTINVAANGVAAADIVTIDSSSSSGGESLSIDTGGTPGTFATGGFGRVNYQAAGRGLIENASSKPSFSDSLTGVASGTLNVNLNTLFTSPTALATTISNSSGELEADIAGIFTHFFPISDLASVSVGGTTAGSALTVDYSSGDPLPSSGLTYDPPAATGNGTNTLTLQGGSFTSETYGATGPGAGSITYSDSSQSNVPITFSNLSPVDDTVPSPTFICNAPPGATTVNVNTGPIVGGVQTDQINDGGTSTFELINFGNKTAATVNVPASGATTTLNYPVGAAGLSALDVVSGGGNETVNVQATPAGVTTNTDTGSAAGSTTKVGLGANLGAIDGNVFVKSTGGGNTLAINDSSETSGQTYDITGSQVTATSFPALISFSGGGITTLDLTSAGLGDMVNFTGPVQSDVRTYNLSADGGSGPNTLKVTSNASTLGLATAGVITFGTGEPLINYTNFQTIDATKPASPPAGTGVTFSASEGQLLNNVVVATFTESDLGNIAGDFIASINWGDGSGATAGTVALTGGNSYNILGSHTYTTTGTFTVNVTLTDTGSTGSTTVAGTTINVTSTGPVNSVPNPIVSTSNVAAAALTAQGATATGVEGKVLTAASTGVLVATFMDAVSPGPPADYSASIVWGDGSPATASTQITSQGTPNGVVFSVFGNHTYPEEGTYPITVTITKPASGSAAIASGQAVIADAQLTAAAASTIVANTGNALAASTIVGTFTDANPLAPITDFTATIDWGDGSPASAGTITQPHGVGEAFDVTGGHNYATPGTYDPIIVVTDVGGSKVTLNATVGPAAVITVTDLAVSGSTKNFTATEGTSTGLFVLATFTDPNTLATVADVSASLPSNGWGDGTPMSPTAPGSLVVQEIGVTPLTSATNPGAPIFEVLGSHTYADETSAGTPDVLSVTITTLAGVTRTLSTAGVGVRVLDARLTSSNGTTITGSQGTATAATTLIGTFTDANPGATSADFLPLPADNGGSVVVNWGDGSPLQSLASANITPAPPTTQGTGVFSIVAAHLYAEVGQFPITIVVTDDGGASTTISSTALITKPSNPTGPVIDGMVFNRAKGQVDYIIQDPDPAAAGAPSGVSVNTLLNSSNYLLTKVHANKAYPGKWIVTRITATPDPTIPYAYDVAVTFNRGSMIAGGFYLFTIRGSSNGNSSVQDLAGNHLDGVFYGSFPSGNGIPGSDFVAMLASYGYKNFPPRTIIGTANAANGGNGDAPIGTDLTHRKDTQTSDRRNEKHAEAIKLTRLKKPNSTGESSLTLHSRSALAEDRARHAALAAIVAEATAKRPRV